MKRSFLVLLLIIAISGASFAFFERGFSNLSYGIVNGTKDLKKIFATPFDQQYPGNILGVLGTTFASLCDIPVFNLAQSSFPLKNTAAFFSKTAEPIFLGTLYVAFGWNNKELARKMAGSLFYTRLSVTALKHLVGKSRPDLGGNPTFSGPHIRSGNNAFPSGHTATGFSLATILSEEYPKYRTWFYSWSAAIGLSRIVLNKHWISDIVGGAFIGTLTATHYLRALKEH